MFSTPNQKNQTFSWGNSPKLDATIREFISADPTMNFDAARELAEASVAPELSSVELDDVPLTPIPESWQRPTGLLGDIAEYIYQSSVLPNIEVALAGAIAFMAGICGREYQTPTGAGLNQYLVLLGETGQGKEAMSRGMGKLYNAVQAKVPGIQQFAGPAYIASGQGLLNWFKQSFCFWTLQKEIGYFMQRLNKVNPNQSDLVLFQMLHDLFHGADNGYIFNGSAYADSTKNPPISITRPSVTLVGESTYSEFYKGISDRNISSGFIPRLTVITIPLNKPPYNPDAANYPPPEWLVSRIADMVANVLKNQQTQTFTVVGETPDAFKFQKHYRDLCEQMQWRDIRDVTNQVWNRAHIRMLRLAALIAIGNNPYSPVIQYDDYKWAEKLINMGTLHIQKQFVDGEIGAPTFEKQKDTVRRYLIKQLNSSWSETFMQYGITSEMWKVKAVTRKAIWNNCKRAFEDAREFVFDAVLKDFEKSGYIVAVDVATKVSWNKRGDVWAITPDVL